MQDNHEVTKRPPMPQPVPIFDSALHTLEHTSAGRPYTLSVWLPPTYNETPAKSYPVVYLLDANTLFGMAASTALALELYHEIPDVIVVGIGIPMRQYDDWGQHRARDFTPTVDPDEPDSTGEGPRFLQVLQTDVIPFIDTRYRTTPGDRTLFGYSLGGLFVTYVYLQSPGLFERYVAGSPVLSFNHRLVFTLARATPTATLALPTHLVLSAGAHEAEYRATNDAFAQLLRERTGDSVRLSVLVFDGETHSSGIARAFSHGLKTVFGN